jgi:predicted enzyme related to lactoylglutathione lyase
MNRPSYFEIQADDLKRTVEFYRPVFGWTFTRAEGLPAEYWRIETDGLRGGLPSGESASSRAGHECVRAFNRSPGF